MRGNPNDEARDWTVDPDTGRSNASPLFLALLADVERSIGSGQGGCLDRGWVSATARTILARIAHAHGLAPVGEARPSCGATRSSECQETNPEWCCMYGNTIEARIYRARKAVT